jgi:hypothetical protein
MELRLQIPDDVVRKFQDRLGSGVKMTDVARDALTLFKWAVDERAKGRVVLSSDEEGENIIRLVMPSIENVKRQPGFAGTPVETVTEAVQRGVDTVLEAQKEILASATKQATSAHRSGKAG